MSNHLKSCRTHGEVGSHGVFTPRAGRIDRDSSNLRGLHFRYLLKRADSHAEQFVRRLLGLRPCIKRDTKGVYFVVFRASDSLNEQ